MGGAYTTGLFKAPEFSIPFILDVAKHAILPALSLILASVGFWALGMRGMGVTVQGEDYVQLCRAQGLEAEAAFLRVLCAQCHPAPGHQPGPGVRRHRLAQACWSRTCTASRASVPLLNAAILANDYFVIYGIGFITIVAVGVSMLVVDLLYPLLDPRIRYDRK